MADELNMNAQSQLPLPGHFEGANSPRQVELWTKWFENFGKYRIATGLQNRPEIEQVATLLYMMGECADDLIITLGIDEDNAGYDVVVNALNGYFNARGNIAKKRAEFNMRFQECGEPVEKFIDALFRLADCCEYGLLRDEMIQDRILVGVRDKALSDKLSSEADLTLEETVHLSRQVTSREQDSVLAYEKEVDTANIDDMKSPGSQKLQGEEKNSISCTGPRHRLEECLAKDKGCTKCKNKGHLSQVCWTRMQKVNEFTKDIKVPFLKETNDQADDQSDTDEKFSPLREPQEAGSTEVKSNALAAHGQDVLQLSQHLNVSEQKPTIFINTGGAFPQPDQLDRSMEIKIEENLGVSTVCADDSNQVNGQIQLSVTQKGNNKPFVCCTCGKRFHLMCRHLLTHSKEKPHVCNDCGRRFRVVHHLKIHMLVHTGDKPHVCKDCGKEFGLKRALNRHIMGHLNVKPHACSLCGKGFVQLHHLKGHVQSHTRKMHHMCENCGKRLTDSNNLKKHILTCIGKKLHACNVCDKEFKFAHNLKCHMLIHSDKKPHVCTDCGKGYRMLSRLKVHMLIHSGHKPHKCNDCSMRFTHLTYLCSHMRTHTGEKPYLCSECGRGFGDSQTLKKPIGHTLGRNPICVQSVERGSGAWIT